MTQTRTPRKPRSQSNRRGGLSIWCQPTPRTSPEDSSGLGAPTFKSDRARDARHSHNSGVRGGVRRSSDVVDTIPIGARYPDGCLLMALYGRDLLLPLNGHIDGTSGGAG